MAYGVVELVGLAGVFRLGTTVCTHRNHDQDCDHERAEEQGGLGGHAGLSRLERVIAFGESMFRPATEDVEMERHGVDEVIRGMR